MWRKFMKILKLLEDILKLSLDFYENIGTLLLVHYFLFKCKPCIHFFAGAIPVFRSFLLSRERNSNNRRHAVDLFLPLSIVPRHRVSVGLSCPPYSRIERLVFDSRTSAIAASLFA
jgi:hypothetical protein